MNRRREAESFECPAWAREIASGTFRRVGDRDQVLFGPVGSVVVPPWKNAQALPGSAIGDRDKVNPARSTRTRFYSARKTRGGIATAASGDCAEMNPPAASHRFCDGGRETRFRLGHQKRQPGNDGNLTM
jgi:hypothetical protein